MRVRGVRGMVFIGFLIGVVFLVMGNFTLAQQKTLDVVIHDAPWRPGYYAAVKLFEQKFGVKVKTHVLTYGDLYAKLVTTMTRGGTEFDVTEIFEAWTPFFYSQKFLWPLKEIDPLFEPDPELLTYGHVDRWSFEKNYTTEDGVLYTQTFMGNVNLFWYRKDKYEEAGFPTPPDTWNDALTAAEKLYDPNKPFYGYVQRGRRGDPAIFGWLPLLFSWGGDIFANPPDDWTITINNKRAKEALKFTLDLMKWGPPGQGDIDQGDIIGLLCADRVLQAIAVCAAFSHFDNPKESVVPWKIEPTVIPKSSYGMQYTPYGVIGWGIPKGSKDPELALDFIKFFVSYEGQMEWTKNGGVPTRMDIYTSELATQKEYRYLKAMKETFERNMGKYQPRLPEWFEIQQEALGKELNAAFVGLKTPEQALDDAARKIEEIIRKRRL